MSTPSANKHLHRMLVDLYRRDFEARHPVGHRPEVSLEVAVEFVVSALIGTLQAAIERNDPSTPEVLHEMFGALAGPGVKRTLGLTLP